MSTFRFSFRQTLSVLFLLAAQIIFAQAPDRSKPPELGPPPALKVPAIQHFKLSNGIPVTLIEKPQVPLVDVVLQINVGSAMDPADKIGLASLTLAMLDEGAGTRNALQIADEVDFLGASLSTGAGFHTASISLHTPLARLDQAMSVMAEVALRPTFPGDELDRQRKQRLTGLAQAHDNPNTIAAVLYNRVLFGEQHPYGQRTGGVEKTLRAFTVQDLKNFHATHFVANNANLIVVGATTGKAILPKLEAAFGKWKAGKVSAPVWPEATQVADRQIYLVDKPGAAQSVIRIGRLGVARLTPDYNALVVMNTILGGSFTSRLNQNLRETHGYAYGASSGFGFNRLPGAFTAAASVQTDATDKSLVEFMKELNAIRAEITAEEMTRAKNYVALSYPSDFQTTGQIAGELSQLVTYGLPDTYFNNYVNAILGVTKEQALGAAQKYIEPEKIAIIVVGDRAKIEAGIRALNLGPVNLLTIEDVLGKAPVLEGTN